MERTPVILPDAEGYQLAVEMLDERIEEQGGPSSYLHNLRERRRSSDNYTNFLSRALQHAMMIEGQDEYGNRISPETRGAEAALSGYIFGNEINDMLYPAPESLQKMYYLRLSEGLSDEELAMCKEYFASKQYNYAARIALLLMAKKKKALLTAQTIERISAWSSETVRDPSRSEVFIQGCMVALQAGYVFNERGRTPVMPPEPLIITKLW